MSKTPVDIARAALLEVGRGDLIEWVHANKKGWPSIKVAHRTVDDVPTIVRAFWLAHIAFHPLARIGETGGIHCPTCDQSWESWGALIVGGGRAS